MRDNILNKKFSYVQWHSVYYIAVINVAVFFATQMMEIRIQGIPLTYWLSLIPVFVREGYVWQLFTYMFVHGSATHLLFNMYALLAFGSLAERSLGSKEFLLFYLLSGFFCGLLNYAAVIVFGGFGVAIMGASGAIYALLFLIAVLFPYNRVLLFFIIPLKMPLAVLALCIIEVTSQLTGTSADIAHLIHLAGIAVAWIYCIVRFRISPLKVWKHTL